MRIVESKKKLSLKNDGKLELFFFGAGTPFTKTLNNNNFILIKGDTHIVVDFGVTAPVAFTEETGLSPIDIEVILPTHSHADHIGGLEYLALFNRYIAQSKKRPKLKMIVTKKYQKILWECSLRGGMEWNETSSSGEKLNFPDYFVPVYPKLIKRSPRLIYELDFDGIHFELFGTNHIPDNAQTQKQAFPSFGLFVDNRLMISCDTKFDPELISRYADRSEVMFHDTSMQPNPVHASLPQLQTLPADIKKKIYLMHYGDDWAKYDISEFAGFARQGFRYIFD